MRIRMQFDAARLLHSGAMFILQTRIATRESEFNSRPRGPRGTKYLAVGYVSSRGRILAHTCREYRAAKALEKSDTSNLDSARQRARSRLVRSIPAVHTGTM